MGSWLDPVIAAWLALAAFNGLRAGLFQAGGRLAGFFVGFWAGGLLAARVAAFMGERLGLEKVFNRWLANNGALPPGAADRPVASLPLDRLPELLQQVGFPPEYQKLVLGQMNDALSAHTPAQTLGETISRILSQMVLEAAAFVLIFSFVHWGTVLLGKVLQQTIGRLPPLWGFNRLGGAALGSLQGVVGITVTLGFLAPVAGFLQQPALAGAIARSTLAPPFIALFQWVLRLGG